MAHSVVTANRLGDGAVVYLASEGRWTQTVGSAQAVQADAVESLLDMAERSVTDRLVVGPYAIPVEMVCEGLRPSHIKERIRAVGPTVRPDLCKPVSGSITEVC